jgi:protein-S-isoprenylcysteine O-methyltransferase Ste14
MATQWHHSYFPLPLLLSLFEWSIFSLYWSAAARNRSRPISSESSKSRRLHEVLVNIAFLLVVLPVRELSPRFLPGIGWTAWLGLSIQTVSVASAVWARRHLASHWSGEITIKVDHELIRSGPYRFVRHPIYAAILGMFVGGAMVSGQLLAFLGVIIAAFAYWRKILLEEANLRRAFGLAYDVYQRQTGSLIPRPRAREHDPWPKPGR